jgi:adenylylsulfate kinase
MKNNSIESRSVVWHNSTATRQSREEINGHPSFILWFTGLSGAGKSSLAFAVEKELHQMYCHTFVLDGDNVRHGLCADLDFSAEDRSENIRRVGEVAKLFIEAGVITLTAFISPFRNDRKYIRSLVPHKDFLEIYCHCPLEICEQRDARGIYKRARAGEIKDFTGISSPYEAPADPELVIETDKLTMEESVARVMQLLRKRGIQEQ